MSEMDRLNHNLSMKYSLLKKISSTCNSYFYVVSMNECLYYSYARAPPATQPS